MNNFFVELGSGAAPWYAIAIAAVCAYFLGNVNPAIIIGRAKGVDVRAHGSGSAGATNAQRTLGNKAGAVTFVIDVIKGWVGYYIPLLIFLRITLGNDAIFSGMVSSQSDVSQAALTLWDVASYAPAMLCGLCVVLGHMYPAVFGFRGGKGVSTTFGVLLAAAPLYALVLLAIVIVFTAIFRYVSLSVIIAVAAALIIIFAGAAQSASPDGFSYSVGFMSFNYLQPLWVVIILALIVWKHRGNISRLFKGQESKLSLGSKKGGAK